ncbi:gp58-like family protein, partial [Limosilactobacillus reuteri]
QMDKPANNTENSSWIAKPSIRRQNASTVNAIQTLTASIDGLQSAVTNYQKDASSKYTQLSDLMQSKVNKGELESVRTQLASSINERIQKGNLITQFNLEAGRTLIQSNKIYFDADSFVMSPNSKAFIPSAYITNINADKITTGTLDAAKFNVKNFSADNITGGTLNGVVVKTGANDRYFQTSKNNIYWVRNGSMSLVGNDTYLNSANGLNIADMNNIQLTTWGGATVNKDGSITNNSGNYGHPKIVIDREGNFNPDDPYGAPFAGGPGNSEIVQWVGNKEYTVLTRNQGFTVRLNDGNNKSTFTIQKDNKVGVYVGGGDDGSEIQIAGFGPIKLQGRHIDDGFNDGMTHTFGNVQVDNLHVRKWLGVDQSKNAIVKTSQGPVTINAYETAEYYFGDIGEGQTSTDGIAYIGIEKLFNETVNTTIPYHVFITAYGPGNIWVDQREHSRFIVKSDQPNLKFSWEIKAKRKGYEQTRLQNVNDKLNHMAATS